MIYNTCLNYLFWGSRYLRLVYDLSLKLILCIEKIPLFCVWGGAHSNLWFHQFSLISRFLQQNARVYHVYKEIWFLLRENCVYLPNLDRSCVNCYGLVPVLFSGQGRIKEWMEEHTARPSFPPVGTVLNIVFPSFMSFKNYEWWLLWRTVFADVISQLGIVLDLTGA